jgi:hypothetical protein
VQRFDYWVRGAPDETGIRPSIAERGFTSQHNGVNLDALPVTPFPDGTGALAVLRETAESFLMVYAHPMRLTTVRIPEADLRALKGDLKPLLALARSDLDEPQPLTATTRWTFEIRREALYRALEIFDGDMHQLLSLLSGALTGVGLAITHFPASFSRRYQLIQGLMMLLPSPLRYLLTFSMNSRTAPPDRPRLIFVQGDYQGERRQAEWGQKLLIAEVGVGQPYVEYLRARWDGDLDDFVRVLMALDKAAYQIPTFGTLAEAVEAVIGVIVNETDETRLPVATMIALLEDDSLDDETRDSYIDTLLSRALDDRDATASHWLALQMEQQPALNERLDAQLEAMLDTQPDAVYAFVRAHLNAGGTLERWLPLLHRAARSAFALVLASEDGSSIMSWLQLLAREPERYQMAEIVHEAILGSVPLAHQNAGLARDLLVRAIKRDPQVLDSLLNDPQFEQALAPEIQQALYHQQPDAIAEIIDQSRELFLLAVARALPHPNSINERLAVMLWHVYAAYPSLVVAPPYHPLNLLRRLIGPDRAALPQDALIGLLAAMLAENRDDLFVEFITVLASSDDLTQVLPPVLRMAERTPDQVVNLVTQLSSSGLLTQEATLSIYISVLDAANWEERYTLPFVDPLARLIAQTPNVTVPAHALWHMVERVTTTRTADSTVKVVVRRLLTTVIEPHDEDQLLQDLLRLRKLIHTHSAARAQLMQWWTSYLEGRSIQQLAQLDKLLSGQRALDELRDSLATAIGVRRLFADRDLRQWSDDIATTYRVLRALSEGFDPEQRSGSIDVVTLQRLLIAAADWPSDQKQVLAATLRDLAELLPIMADARTKPSLIRSDDQLERRLMSGELQPQSAIDVMRWLAGFLEGAQKNGL